MSIKKEWIDKIREEAFAMGRQFWALVFNFGDALHTTENFYIIDEKTFIKLQNYLQEEEK